MTAFNLSKVPSPTFKSQRLSRPPSAASQRVSDLSLIKEFEGLRLKAYLPTPNDVPTIGYGHTKGVFLGQVISKDQAEAYLREDIAWVEEVIHTQVKVPLSRDQFDALASWVYNLGGTNLSRSTLLRKLNSGDYRGAASEFQRWNRQGSTVLPGLTRRRMKEAALFLRGTKG